MSAAFVSGGVALLYMFIIYKAGDLTIIHYIVALVLVIISFPLSVAFLFKELSLEVLVDKDAGLITFNKHGIVGSTVLTKQLSDLDRVRVNHLEFKMSNPDGVEFVKKIALGHGTVIPGFGVSEHMYAVECLFRSEPHENVIIYSSESVEDAQKLTDEMENYIKQEGKSAKETGH
ncbi:MAG: hypothetical protein H7844_04205 [Nitrospirae bacterium YQR-1]